MLKIYPIAIIAILVFLLIYTALAMSGVIFHYESGEAIGAVSGWCERVSGGIFREPVNTISNLGFVIAGLYMLRSLSKEHKICHIGNVFT